MPSKLTSCRAATKGLLLVGVLAFAFGAFAVQPAVHNAVAACLPDDKVNSTTADDAKKAMERAGYTNVKILAKGCDNAWHGTATYNGQPVFVVWNKEGQVLPEGD